MQRQFSIKLILFISCSSKLNNCDLWEHEIVTKNISMLEFFRHDIIFKIFRYQYI